MSSQALASESGELAIARQTYELEGASVCLTEHKAPLENDAR
jgi:hypothetical protein